MAFSLESSSDRDDDHVLADINVTPLVDVMLVLLIIFMIAAPMLHQGIEVALPEANAGPLPQRTQEPLVVSVNRDGLIYLFDEPIHSSQLVDRLQPLVAARSGETVFVKGDRDVPYGEVMEVLDLLREGGIVNVGMVTERRQR